MLRHLRALLRTRSPHADFIHFHIDDDGRKVPCDESRCRPAPKSQLPYTLFR